MRLAFGPAPRHFLLAGLAAAFLFGTAACGSDDDEEEGDGGNGGVGGTGGGVAAGDVGGSGGQVSPADLECSPYVEPEYLEWVYPLPAAGTLGTVWVSPEGHAWVGGQLGALLRYDGSSWQVQPPPIGNPALDPTTVYSLWGTSETDLWAVDGYGHAVHFDGSHWSQTDGPNFTRGIIHGSSPSDVWWIDDDEGAHWDGTSWSEPMSIATTSASGLYVSSPTDAWATGGTTISHWDGAAWSHAETVSSPIYDLGGSGPSDLWAVSEGYPRHYDGVSWQSVQDVNPGARVRAVWGAAVDDTWFALDDGTLLHRTGPGAVTTYPQPEGGQRFVDLAGHGSTVYGAGYRGTLGRFDGDAWEIDSHGSDLPTPGALCGSGSTVWVHLGSGFGTVQSGDLSTLAEQSVTPDVSDWRIEALWVIAPDDAWAVGYSVLHFDGTEWREVTITENELPLFDVWARSSDDVWAVGLQGTVLHYDGAAWSLMPYPNADDLEFVTGLPDGQIITGTVDGSLMLRRAGEWVDLSGDAVFGNEDPSVVDAVSDGRYVWLIGEYGQLFVYDGTELIESANCGLGHQQFQHAGVGSDGTVWIGAREELLRVGTTEVESVASAHLELDHIWSGDDGRVWLATGFGLQTLAPQ